MNNPAPIPPPTPPINHPSGLSAEDRNWAVAAHLSSLSGYIGVPFGHILGPLVVWLIKKDQSAFVNEAGKEALNYGISLTIYLVISAILAFFCIGFFLLAGLVVFDIIVTIMAAVAVSNGQLYRYPAIFRFVS